MIATTERLGASIAIGPSASVDTAGIVAQLRAMDLHHLRMAVAEDTDATLLDEVFATLGACATLLLSLHPNNIGAAGEFLDRHATHVAAVETIVHRTNIGAVAHAAERVRDAGKALIIGLGDVALLTELAEAGVLHSAHALGVPMPIHAMLGDQALASLATARLHAPGLRLWITQPRPETPFRHVADTAASFLDAIATGAERIYWPVLSDSADGVHGGFYESSGEKSLLGRLLTGGGVEEVQRVMSFARRAPTVGAARPVLVTGGAGFIGANLADRLASHGHQVHIYDALARPGVERNLRWLAKRHPTKISFELGDLRDEPSLAEAAARAQAVFHLAGQVAVTTSMVRPLEDFDVNARGTLALLDALRRRNPHAPLIFASTNKVYGDLADIALVRDGDRYLPAQADIRAHGVSETRPLCFHTPYGCSKGTADQYVLDYAHSFGLRTAVLRMSCIYGERQFGTEDQGWVAHFLLRAIAGEPVTIYGDGSQVRDVLHVGDAVHAYLAAWRDIGTISGRAYNLGGGPANAISLLQLIDHIEAMLGTRVDVTFAPWRPGDQRYFVADTRAVRRDLDLPPALDWRAGLRQLAEHFGATLQADAHVQRSAQEPVA